MAKVLIVDDQPYFREFLSKELILEGYEVRNVGDTESVREHLKKIIDRLAVTKASDRKDLYQPRDVKSDSLMSTRSEEASPVSR